MKKLIGCLVGITLLMACSQKKGNQTSGKMSWDTIQDTTSVIHTISGLSGPESVRYDPNQDVYFVSNFNGNASAIDSNGFISKISPEGKIDSLHFMTGTNTHPMHSPRGMYITGDTLWACDRNGVQAFNRITGKQLRFVDFSSFNPGFLNDIVEGADGNLYVTDTGTSRIYQISRDQVTIMRDSLPAAPNGITRNPDNDQLVLAPWGGDRTFYALIPSETEVNKFRTTVGGGNFDGIEFYSGKLIASSQQDSTLRLINGNDHVFVKLPARPADIGIDTKRNQIAVPFVSRNTVVIWALPQD